MDYLVPCKSQIHFSRSISPRHSPDKKAGPLAFDIWQVAPSPSPLPQGARGESHEALAAPEDVGGEDGERDHEGDPDAVGARQDGQVDAGIDDAEAGVQQIDEESPPLDQQETHADEDVQGGRLGLGEDPQTPGRVVPRIFSP